MASEALTTRLEERLAEVTRQVEFCNNMTIVLSIGFYMVILAALLCSYIFIRNRLDMVQKPPTIMIQQPQNIELERLLAKLLERLAKREVEAVVVLPPPPVVTSSAGVTSSTPLTFSSGSSLFSSPVVEVELLTVQ